VLCSNRSQRLLDPAIKPGDEIELAHLFVGITLLAINSAAQRALDILYELSYYYPA
jgi:hypothetical protein